MAMRWLMRQRCERGSALSSKRSIIVGRSSFATEIPKEKAAPLLMLSSPTNPEYRYFFDVDKESIKFNRKIHLPQIAGHHCIGSSEGFLLSIPICWSPPIHATNPFDDASQLPIPSTSSLRSVDEEEEGFTRHIVRCWETNSGEIIALDFNYCWLFQSKAVLSPSKDFIVLLQNEMADYASLSTSNSEWTSMESICSNRLLFKYSRRGIHSAGVMNDCIFHNNLLYISNYQGNLAIVDLNNPLAPPLFCLDSPLPKNLPNIYRKSLVQSPDGKDLFLLEREANCKADQKLCNETLRFTVFKFDKDNLKWNQVHSIADLVMFIGNNTSICLSASDYPNLNPNSIYFIDYVTPYYDPDHVGDTGVYNLEQETIHHFNLTYDVGQEKLNWPSPIWFLPAQTYV